jgi:hydroxypyruvate isomerase
MPTFAANLTMMFTEAPFLDRFALAAHAGFRHVEFLFPYPFPKEVIAARLRAEGLTLVLHNLPAGNWEAGERGIACHPDRVDEFRAGVQQAISYAVHFAVPHVNCLAGQTPPGIDAATAHLTFTSNLKYAAGELKQAGVKLLIEPINRYDIPGFFLSRTADALSIMDDVGSDNVFLQYDIYHAQRTEGEIAATIARNLPRIAHIQLADNPGRHEPGTGEINYEFLFGHLDAIGYRGCVGCEYKPATTTEAGLGWFTRLHSMI